MRKLVSIQKIRKISPIDGADFIELVHINGWQCVSKKGELKENEMGLYFEIDSFLPLIPEFEFLRKTSFKRMGDKEGIRLKTIKLRGELSQGLMLPLKVFPKLFEMQKRMVLVDKKTGFEVSKYENQENNDDLEFITKMVLVNKKTDDILNIGDDVTELLGVEKYEPPIHAEISGDVVGLFPSFIPKTDEERIQNIPEYFDTFQDVEWEETLKLDGTSMTVFRTMDIPNEQTEPIDGINGKFGVCMRNYELRRSDTNTLWKVALEYEYPRILDEENLEIAIQGELMGPGIQKNREKLNKSDFYIFRIWDIKNQEFYSRKQRYEFISMVKEKYNITLKHAPILNENIKIFQKIKSVNEMLQRAEGKSINHPIREGLVFKSIDKVNGKTISFKAISNKFLLKGGD